MSEPKLNDAVTEALSELLTVEKGRVTQKPWPHPITHGYFNRRMVLEAFLFLGGTGVALEAKDIMEHSGITDKEWPIILQEYMDKGVVLKVSNPFGADMYKLDMRPVNKQATP
jgi:hypothetical protein